MWLRVVLYNYSVIFDEHFAFRFWVLYSFQLVSRCCTFSWNVGSFFTSPQGVTFSKTIFCIIHRWVKNYLLYRYMFCSLLHCWFAWQNTHGLFLFYHCGAGAILIVHFCHEFVAINMDSPNFICTKEEQRAVIHFCGLKVYQVSKCIEWCQCSLEQCHVKKYCLLTDMHARFRVTTQQTVIAVSCRSESLYSGCVRCLMLSLSELSVVVTRPYYSFGLNSLPDQQALWLVTLMRR